MACGICNNKAAGDCDYDLCGRCCDRGDCHRHGWYEYECETCFRLFQNQNNLNQHMQTHKPRDKLCPVCGQVSFKSTSGVTMHVESGYCAGCGERGQKLVRDFMKKNLPQCYAPAICDRSDSSDWNEDPYCRSCDRFFKSMGALLQHMEAKHDSRVGVPRLHLAY
mmetsp:Transcript_85394/g.135361  ORF Transcript_85394/g.135361 Transcript_85394/m.135361 type:complete len:165 (+) Transcript_85394:45-539(+)